MDRIEGDTGTLKGDFARTRTVQEDRGIASDMGLEFVRTLSTADLSEMAGNTPPRDVGSNFRNVDLVIEATDRTDHQIHSNGGLLHGGPEGLRPGHSEREAHHPVHRETGAARHSKRQERPGRSGSGGVRGSVLAPAGRPNAEPRVTPKNHSGAPAKTGQISYEMNGSRLTTHTGSNNLRRQSRIQWTGTRSGNLSKPTSATSH